MKRKERKYLHVELLGGALHVYVDNKKRGKLYKLEDLDNDCMITDNLEENIAISVLIESLRENSKDKEKEVWVVTGESESGDDYGPKRYNKKPDKEDLKNFITDYTQEDIEIDGPGDFGSYVHLKVEKI